MRHYQCLSCLELVLFFIAEFIYRRHIDRSLTGILLILSTVLAMLASNTDAVYYYQKFLHIGINFNIGGFVYQSTIHHFVNDALMAIFFFHIGLELKHEMIMGNLNTLRKAALPMFAAVGGMLVPAVIYLMFTYNNPVAYRGWAIPTATDIAFALGILTLVGRHVPHALKVFLTALAVFDDLGAILIIALFYSGPLDFNMLIGATIGTLLLFSLNRSGIENIIPYLFITLILWAFILHSGIHPTVTGVIAALSIPLVRRVREHKLGENAEDNLISLYDKIFPYVNYLILPLFAFTNAGINIQDVKFSVLFSPVLLGIALGLFVGKPLGISLFAFLGVKSGLAKLPDDLSWSHIVATASICGIGFTMSLFIGDLAFVSFTTSLYPVWVKSGVILGSFASCLAGYTLLKSILYRGNIHNAST